MPATLARRTDKRQAKTLASLIAAVSASCVIGGDTVSSMLTGATHVIIAVIVLIAVATVADAVLRKK